MITRLRRLSTVVILAWVVALGFTAVFVSKVAADPGGRTAGHGYFTNALAPSFGNSVILGGIPGSAQSKAGFISFIRSKVTAGSTRDKTGAQFIIRLMMANGSFNHTRPSYPGDFNTWAGLINQGTVSVSVANYGYTWDAAYDSGHNDDYFYDGPSLSAPALIFRQNGTIVFVVRLACANPIGNLPGLHQEPQNATLDGVKIDNSGVGGYGGGTPAAFTAVPVTVSGVGSQSTNPFYFTGAAGKGPAVPAGTRTVSLGSVPAGWTVQGHAVCEDADPVCTSAYLISHLTGGSATSFSLNFVAGHHYHMRWVFRPNVTSTCTVDTFPNVTVTHTASSFRVGLQLSWWGAPFVAGVNPALNVQVRRHSDGALVVNQSGVNYSVTGTGPADILSDPIAFTPPDSGQYDMQWSLVGNGLNELCPAGNNGSWSNPTVGYAGDQPYFAVTGGDTIAGDANDPTVTSAIRGYNSNDTATGYSGAGAQLAALAAGDISNFVTGRGLAGGGVNVKNGSGLALSNSSPSGTTADYRYGGSLTAIPQAFSIPTGLTGPNLTSGDLGAITTSGVYVIPAGMSIYGQLDGSNAAHPAIQVTLIANHDVTISGNITYKYGSVSEIPQLRLYVQDGNISIDKSVSELHGIFVAEAASGSGNVYTCQVANTNVDYSDSANNVYADQCMTPLTIFGSVTANKLVMGRAYGTWVPGQPNTAPAETIQFTPEVWLHSNPNSYQLDSYQGLPPVL